MNGFSGGAAERQELIQLIRESLRRPGQAADMAVRLRLLEQLTAAAPSPR